MARPYQYLRGLIMQHGDKNSDAAHAILIKPETFSRKLNCKLVWTADEMYGIMDRYHVPYTQMAVVFPKGGMNEQ